MSGDGIRAYAGEFLTSPAGLELSMNWCGHACTYCFANLGRKRRAWRRRPRVWWQQRGGRPKSKGSLQDAAGKRPIQEVATPQQLRAQVHQKRPHLTGS